MENEYTLKLSEEKTKRQREQNVTILLSIFLIILGIGIIVFLTTSTPVKATCEITDIEYSQESCWYNNTGELETLSSYEKREDNISITTREVTHKDCIKPHNIKCEFNSQINNAQIIELLKEANRR